MFPALPQNPGPWLFVFWAALLLCFWSLVVALISLVGGWNSLAKEFRVEETTFRINEKSDGKRYRWASMSMGPTFFPTNYGHCLDVYIDERGIRIKVSPILRMLHPPLLIPWSKIESCELDKVLLFFPRATVQIEGRADPLRFMGSCANEVYRAWSTDRSNASIAMTAYGKTSGEK